MKRLFIAAVLVVTALCAQAQTKFSVKGTCAQDMGKVYIYKLTARPSIVDSVDVKGGKFNYTTTAEQNAFIGIGSKDYYMPVINDGTPIEVDLTAKTLKGSDMNKQLVETDNKFDEQSKVLNNKIAELQKQAEAAPESLKELQGKAMEMMEEAESAQISQLKQLTHTLIPALYLPNLAYSMSFEDMTNFLHPEAPYYNHPNMQNVKRMYESLKKRQPGKMFIDMEIADMDGNMHKLSEWCGKGKVVLIDFWASWCGPCRQEMPTVVESYNRFKDKGYEIIGISFDSKADAWKAGVKQLGMTWPQLSDLKYWKSEAAGVYGISSIPANILLDGDGKIIAIDLRGEKLLSKLAEVLK